MLTPEAAALPRLLDAEAFLDISGELSWWVAGLAVLSDWIGSNTDFFGYRADPVPLDDYWVLAKGRAASAVRACGVVPSNSVAEHAFDVLFLRITTPSPLQDRARTLVLPSGPQIHLLEDVTGAGKTEAALMLTHRLSAYFSPS